MNNKEDRATRKVVIDPGHGGLWEIQILRNDYKY